MNALRVLTIGAATGACLLGAGVAYHAVFNPMEARRNALAADLEAIPSDGEALPRDEELAERVKWQAAVLGKRGLWEPLVAPAVQPPIAGSLDQLVANITAMPGRIGGANPRVRLTTPEYPQGRFFRKGDTVRPNVIVKDITSDAVVLEVRQNAQVSTHRLPL